MSWYRIVKRVLVISVVNAYGHDTDSQTDSDIDNHWYVSSVIHIHNLAIVDGHNNCDNGGA